MKENEKGLTLIELLATMTMLSIVIISVIYVYSNFHSTARQQKVSTDAVNAARTVLEELKWSLPKNEASLSLFGQTIDLSALRNATSGNEQTLTYPNVNNDKYLITIKSTSIENSIHFKPDVLLELGHYFRLIDIVIIEKRTNSIIYTLQSYVEYN